MKKDKEAYNKIHQGQLWESRSEGLAKGKIIKILGRARQGYWKTIRVDNKAPKKRTASHIVQERDLVKYYKLVTNY